MEKVEELVMSAYGASELHFANPLLDLALIIVLANRERVNLVGELVKDRKRLVKELVLLLGRLYE